MLDEQWNSFSEKIRDSACTIFGTSQSKAHAVLGWMSLGVFSRKSCTAGSHREGAIAFILRQTRARIEYSKKFA